METIVGVDGVLEAAAIGDLDMAGVVPSTAMCTGGSVART